MLTGNIITDFSLLILFLPLVAFVINILVGKKLPRQGDWVAVGAILITLILSLSLFMNFYILLHKDKIVYFLVLMLNLEELTKNLTS